MTNLNLRILPVITFASLTILVTILGVAPIFAQVGGPSNPNANVTTAYNLLHPNSNSSNIPPLSIKTDLPSYNQGDTIVITGHVGNVTSGTALTLRVFNSHTNLISVTQFTPSADGSFTKTLLITGPLWTDAGTYTAVAQYGRYIEANATFYFNGGTGTTTITQAISATYPLQSGSQIYNIPYIIKGATVSSMNIFTNKYTLEITLSPATSDGSITVTLPRNLIDAKMPSPDPNAKINELQDDKFIVAVGDISTMFSETKNLDVRILSIPFHAGDTKVDIVGTVVNAVGSTPSSNVITVTTDKSSYNSGNTITISGTVNQQLNIPISIVIKNPSQLIVLIAQANPNSDNTYSTQLPVGGDLWNTSGTYEIDVTYGGPNSISKTTFQFTSSGTTSPPQSPSTLPSGADITISQGAGVSASTDCVTANNCFSPNPLNVVSGTTVTWTNTDKLSHTITSGKPTDNNAGSLFDSGLIKSGNTFQFTFVTSGEYGYFCTVHPWMTGQVIVGGMGGHHEQENEDQQRQHEREHNNYGIINPTQQDIQNINQAKTNQTIAAEVNVGDNQYHTTSIDNNVSVQTIQNTPDSLGVQVSATNQTGPKVIMFNLNATTINLQNLKDLGVMYDGKLIQPAPNMDAILHAKSTDNPSFAIVVTQSGIQVLVLVPHFSTHSITITNMSKVITPAIPEFGPIASMILAIAIVSIIALSAKTGLRFLPKTS